MEDHAGKGEASRGGSGAGPSAFSRPKRPVYESEASDLESIAPTETEDADDIVDAVRMRKRSRLQLAEAPRAAVRASFPPASLPRERRTAYDRHVEYVNNYILRFGRREQAIKRIQDALPTPKTDSDIIAENFKFVRPTYENEQSLSWEDRQAKRYYDKLFREYAIVDLSRWRNGLVGMRWRTEDEVVLGKGHFVCAEKRCSSATGLRSLRVPFRYQERGENHETTVKVRLCEKHAARLAKAKPGVAAISNRNPSASTHRNGREARDTGDDRFSDVLL